jgi:hypothetical protein
MRRRIGWLCMWALAVPVVWTAAKLFPSRPMRIVAPDIPTVAESGWRSFGITTWVRLLAPEARLTQWQQ